MASRGERGSAKCPWGKSTSGVGVAIGGTWYRNTRMYVYVWFLKLYLFICEGGHGCPWHTCEGQSLWDSVRPSILVLAAVTVLSACLQRLP